MTKKGRHLFGKKVHPRQNPGYAYGEYDPNIGLDEWKDLLDVPVTVCTKVQGKVFHTDAVRVAVSANWRSVLRSSERKTESSNEIQQRVYSCEFDLIMP